MDDAKEFFGPLWPVVLTLAAAIAHALVFQVNQPREEAQLDMMPEHQEMRRHLQSAFEARGVKFSPAGVPVMPEVVFDLSRLDPLLQVMTMALREACEALSEADRALNPHLPTHLTRTSEDIWELTERALAAGAYKRVRITNPDTGEMVLAVVRAFFCDPVTGRIIRPVYDTPTTALDTAPESQSK